MSLYPTLEDMQVDKMIQAQNHAAQATQAIPAHTQNPYPELNNGNSALVMYPNLGEFMGLDLSEDMIRSNMPEYSNAIQPVSKNVFCVDSAHELAELNLLLVQRWLVRIEWHGSTIVW